MQIIGLLVAHHHLKDPQRAQLLACQIGVSYPRRADEALEERNARKEEHAGGNLHNVQVVPLANVQADTDQPVPFGFNGKVGGVRATIQGWLLSGVNGNNSLAAILAAAKPLGHSSKKPVCLHALLNGGYSPSSSVWGTAYVKLVVQPQAQ